MVNNVPSNHRDRALRILLFLALFFVASLALSDERKKDSPWVPLEDRVRIWDEVVAKELGLTLPLPVPKPYTLSENGLEATFEKDGAKWTIIGANAPIVNPTAYPKDWPVKGHNFEVLVIPEPITNYKILPFTESIENAVKSNTISITAARDSFEPGSFVIRSGDVPLEGVRIEATDLVARIKGGDGRIKKAIIPKESVDIRVVKCWYQAGTEIFDVKNKILVPELLLHDPGIVKTHYDTQVNLVKNLDTIEDSDTLKPFSVPNGENRQIWLTLNVGSDAASGNYSGLIKINDKSGAQKKLKLKVEVLPWVLPKSALNYSFYYIAKLSPGYDGKPKALVKNEQQMFYELQDMVAHGINNPTVYIRREENNGKQDFTKLSKIIDLRRQAGIADTEPLLYVELKMDYRDMDKLKERIKDLLNFTHEKGIKEVYVYGKDEARGEALKRMRVAYESIHAAGGKNFVAGWLSEFLKYVPEALDIFIVGGNWRNRRNPAYTPTPDQVTEAKKLGKKVWLYGYPQTGMEEPATYRENYGINLWARGMNGACAYAYQTDEPWGDASSAWNEFASDRYRSQTMAYPTTGKPIPTLQWEGWREAVSDVRYLTLVKEMRPLSDEETQELSALSPSEFRKEAVTILKNQQK